MQGVVIDWDTTRIADEYLELFVGEYSAKLIIHAGTYKVVVDEEDNAIRKNIGPYQKIIAKVNQDIKRAA